MISSNCWVSLGSFYFGGQKYENKTKPERDYWKKEVPTYPQMAASEVDFGLGPKKIDGVLLHDVKRMYHSFQGEAIPHELTKDDVGANGVFHALYRMAGDNDDFFFRVSQIYNQRIGLDLVSLAREQIGEKTESLDSQNYHLNLSLEEVFPKKSSGKKIHLIATAFISGEVLDPETFEVLPIRYHVSGRYDLTTDQALHTITYRLIVTSEHNL